MSLPELMTTVHSDRDTGTTLMDELSASGQRDGNMNALKH